MPLLAILILVGFKLDRCCAKKNRLAGFQPS